jgi:hypothetical protein
MTKLSAKLERFANGHPEIAAQLRPFIDKVAKSESESEFEEQFDKAKNLSAVDPSVAQLIVQSGLDDGGAPGDDKVSVSKASIEAENLKPSQTTMVLEKAVGMALGMLKSGKIGGDLGAMISQDNHILDGHHRWAATILAGGGKVGGYKAALKGPDLLKVLNIVSKGAFGVRNGNPGKGNISDFTPKKVEDILKDYVENGMGGQFPMSADTVKEILEKKWGSVEKGIKEMSENANNISKNVPSWAPDRKDMPVIEPNQVPEAADLLNRGEVDWAPPYKQARSLRASLIHLAHAHPEFRGNLLPLLKK